MIEVLRKIWRFAGEEQRNIRKSMVLGFFYAIFHMFQIAAIYVVVLALVDGSTSAAPAWQALALLLVENGHDVTLWSHRQEKAEELRRTRENPMLKGVPLPDGLALTSDRECVKNCKVVVLATPSFAVRTTARAVASLLEPSAVLVSVSKGIEKETSLLLHQVVEQEMEALGIQPTREKIEELVETRLRDEVRRGVQTIQYQVLTLLTTNGQAPFVTVFMYLGEAKNCLLYTSPSPRDA